MGPVNADYVTRLPSKAVPPLMQFEDLSIDGLIGVEHTP